MQREAFIWRLVFENAATLTELETTWSMDDVRRACAILEYQQAAQEKPSRDNS